MGLVAEVTEVLRPEGAGRCEHKFVWRNLEICPMAPMGYWGGGVSEFAASWKCYLCLKAQVPLFVGGKTWKLRFAVVTQVLGDL